MKRETGFYWILFSDKWEIAYFNNGIWHVVGSEFECFDSALKQIDENQIKRDETKVL